MAELIGEIDELGITAVQRPKLPSMNEFSPGQLGSKNILWLISLIHTANRDIDEIKRMIISEVPGIANTSDPKERLKRAGNVLSGMHQCGLLRKSGRNISGEMTDIATRILACTSDKDASDLFSIHLLESCNGLEVFDVVNTIRSRGEKVTKKRINDELRFRGFKVTVNSSDASSIRMWLEASGIVDSAWNINKQALHMLIGATDETTSSWSSLSRVQRIFLESLNSIQSENLDSWVSVRLIKNRSELEYGLNVFPEDQLRSKVITPLVGGGWIESKGTGRGRGGDSGSVRALPQLTDAKIRLPIDIVSFIPSELRDRLSKPLSEIFTELDSSDTYTKGLALELLALRVARDIGLLPIGFRERSNKTQGAEVDIIANGVHLHYSRWLIQCKNTKQVRVDDIAKEVGMAVVLKAHVIAIITTGKIGSTVIQYADGLASASSLQAVLIDGSILKKYVSIGPDAIIDHLRDSAFRVLKLKETQAIEYHEE